jgi:hypothetical protein
MSSPETKKPHSTIRHRPIFITSQVTPLVLRASNLSISLRPVVGEREPDRAHWHIAFCLGMAMTLELLLFGHFVG